MITGERCFKGENYTQVLYQIVHDQPHRINDLENLAGNRYQQIARRALAKSPEDRFKTAEDFASALEGLSENGKPVPVEKGSRWPFIKGRS